MNVRLLRKYLLAGGLVALPFQVASSETVYKHVDPEGDVTFSSDPTHAGPNETVVPIEIDPRLSAEEQEAAQRRLEELERAAARLEKERKIEQERAQRIEAAQEELRKARAALEEAKKKTLDDWQYLATGGRVLKQSYFDRVEAAEQRVKEAEETLRTAKSASP